MSPGELRQRRTAPLKHGVYGKSDDVLRLRYRKVRRRVRKLRDATPGPWDPYLGERAAVWAELDLLCAGAFADLTEKGATTPDGEPRRLLAEYRLLREQQGAIRAEMREHQDRLRERDALGLEGP